MLPFFSLAALLLLTTAVAAHDCAVGQVWTYRVRPGDEGSVVQINKIESHPKLGAIYHISLFGLHAVGSGFASGTITQLPHLPVSQGTLDVSVDALTTMAPRPVEYEAGYAEWRRAFDAGRAGIYTISLAEIVTTMIEGLSRAPP